MKITDLSIRRPVTITMVMVAVVLVGLFAVLQLPEDLFPTLNLPVAAVTTSWTNSTPEEVEQQVTSPIEQELQSLPGVSEIDSTSTAGASLVIVEFNYGTNIDQEINQMRSDVSQVANQLPSAASRPAVEQFNPNEEPIMHLSLYGKETQAQLSDLAKNVVQPALAHLNGVAAADTSGALSRQITVNVSPTKLALYHLSITQVMQAIETNNLSADAGQVQKGSLLVPLHVDGQFTSPSQIEQIPIPLSSGGTIPLSEVAKVDNGFADVTLISTVNGEPAVSFSITEATGANTVAVSNEVKGEVTSLQSQLPAGVRLIVESDSANTITSTLSTVVTHTVLGFIFGVLIILLLLRSVRTTFVIAVAIPIAVLSTFLLMYLAGISLNTTTLGSLAVGLGSLVDFSIVVLESIFRARISGLPAREAASQGTKEVGLAVVVAALAQICVFAPSIFVPGIAGQFFRPISLTVSFSHIAALFVALTFTPMLASRFLRGRRFEMEETIPGVDAPLRWYAPFDWFGRGMHDLNNAYRRVLNWSMNHRKTIVLSSTVLMLLSLFLVPVIGFELVPNVPNQQMSVAVTLADGTDLARTNAVTQEIIQLAKSHMPGISEVDAQIGGSSGGGGGGSTNKSSLTLTFNKQTSPTTISKYAHEFQYVTADIPGAEIIATPGSANGSGIGGNSVSVQIQGPDGRTLQILAAQVADLMNKTPGLEYVDNQASTGTPSYDLNISQTALAQYGLTEQEVENALGTAFGGTKASTLYRGTAKYPIMVQLPQSFTQNLDNLSQITIENARGTFVPVTEVASLTTSVDPPQIQHINGVRDVTVSATPYGVTSGRIESQLTSEFKDLRIPAGYTIGFGQNGKFLSSAFKDLGLAVLFSIVLLYMVMASLFENLLTPFVIMFCLPPTFVGSALGLFLTHRSLNIDSAIGVIMVMGLIANNAIVLVDYTNQLRRKGLPLREALLQAGPIRLRPILMSTLTTVLAMLPLVIGFGQGASTLTSMATVIAFGLLFSTLVTLVLVPVIYVISDNWISRFRRRFGGRTTSSSIPQGDSGPHLEM
ncbi:efflux RND transporter permease subunit [Alicyclobacillus sp. SP_1]|uniref:efflux RND transporter permease subunit n=1 Tax=Alicyclobacillus sp. SP_1 TaxID=2942475 RepID=UPI002157C8FA|nr:efflux RND transporter permease subunit [Alicyclobacillus sp. SP_1]